jgi:5-methylcytosine-specific restriction endonuclease McrA
MPNGIGGDRVALAETDPRRGRSGRPWERAKAELFVPGASCGICHGEIVFGLRRNHPAGPSLDHIVSLARGGHPTARENLQIVHFGCNSRKGSGIKRSAAPAARPRSRAW